MSAGLGARLACRCQLGAGPGYDGDIHGRSPGARRWIGRSLVVTRPRGSCRLGSGSADVRYAVVHQGAGGRVTPGLRREVNDVRRVVRGRHRAGDPSLIPARIDRLPWSPFHTRTVVALGGLGPRRPRDHDRELRRRSTQRPHSRSRPSTSDRRTAVRTAVRELGRRTLFDGHAGRLPDRQRPDRVDGRLVHRLDRLPLRDPVHRGDRHRRRVRGDQLGDRRA